MRKMLPSQKLFLYQIGAMSIESQCVLNGFSLEGKTTVLPAEWQFRHLALAKLAQISSSFVKR